MISSAFGGRSRQLAYLLALLPFLGTSVWAQQDDGKAHFELMPYLVLGGMGGDITVRGRTASFSHSAAEVLGDLQFGVMGRTRVTYKKFFVGLDGTYMGLGAANDTVDAGVDQVIVEPSVGVRVAPFLEVLGGAEPLFNVKAGKRETLHAGWKFYYVDYRDNGVNFRYAVLSQGPMLGATFRW